MSNSHRRIKSDIPSKTRNNLISDKKDFIQTISKFMQPAKYDDQLQALYTRDDEIINNNFVFVGNPYNEQERGTKNSQTNNSINPSDCGLINLPQNKDKENLIVYSRKSVQFGNGGTENSLIGRSLNKRRSEITKNIADLTKSIMKEEDEMPFEEELKFLEDFVKKETSMEDEYETQQHFIKIKIDEMVSFLYAFLAIGSALIYHELKNNGDKYALDLKTLDYAITIAILVVSVSVGFFSNNYF